MMRAVPAVGLTKLTCTLLGSNRFTLAGKTRPPLGSKTCTKTLRSPKLWLQVHRVDGVETVQTWPVTEASWARAALAVRSKVAAKRMSRFIAASIQLVAVRFVQG